MKQSEQKRQMHTDGGDNKRVSDDGDDTREAAPRKERRTALHCTALHCTAPHAFKWANYT